MQNSIIKSAQNPSQQAGTAHTACVQLQEDRIMKVESKTGGKPIYYKFCQVCGQWLLTGKKSLTDHYSKQHSGITDALPNYLQANELPRIPKYSNWEEFIADPDNTVPKVSFGFEINKGGRPSIHINQLEPKYDFSQNKHLKSKLNALRTKSQLHQIKKPENQQSVSKYHHRRMLIQLQRELEKAKTEKGYYAPNDELKKRHQKEIKKLEAKHQDQVSFWENQAKRLINEKSDHISITQSLLKEIKDLKSEIEAIKSASQKEMNLIKASSQNHYISLQKIKKDYQDLQQKEKNQKKEILDLKDDIYDLKNELKAFEKDKPGMYEYIYKEKQLIQAETEKKIQAAQQEANIFYRDWQDTNNLLEKEKQDKSKIREANTDVILANSKLQMRIIELEEKIKILENKLSYSIQAKTEAVFRIEELTGEILSDEKKQKLEMVIEGDKILQSKLRKFERIKKSQEAEIKSLKTENADQTKLMNELSIKCFKYDQLCLENDQSLQAKFVKQQKELEKKKIDFAELLKKYHELTFQNTASKELTSPFKNHQSQLSNARQSTKMSSTKSIAGTDSGNSLEGCYLKAVLKGERIDI